MAVAGKKPLTSAPCPRRRRCRCRRSHLRSWRVCSDRFRATRHRGLPARPYRRNAPLAPSRTPARRQRVRRASPGVRVLHLVGYRNRAARPDDADHLPEHGGRVGPAEEYHVGERGVHRTVLQRQSGDRPSYEFHVREAQGPKVLSGQPEHRRGAIYADDPFDTRGDPGDGVFSGASTSRWRSRACTAGVHGPCCAAPFRPPSPRC